MGWGMPVPRPPAIMPGEAILAALADRMGAGVLVCDAKTPDCPIIHVSSGFTVITRYTAEEALGRNLMGLLQGPNPDPAAAKLVHEAIIHGRQHQGEFLCHRKDGASVPCGLTLVPVGESGGRPAQFAVLLTETTDRKKRECQLLDTEAKYRGMFDNAVEGIYQSTPDGNYLAVNPALAKMYGYATPEEMLGEVSDIQNQIYADPAFRDRFRLEVEKTGRVQNLEYRVRRRDGGIMWISESARAVRDAAGVVRYSEGFIGDITQRKDAEAARARLEKEMLQAHKMEAMGTLAGGIAHDFNNILCAMLGLTELTLADEHITGLSRKNLQAVLRSADRAKELVGQILTFSRRSEVEHQPLRLGSILKECVKLLNATLPSSISVSLQCNTEEDTVVADPTEIHQVIMNLGTNAGHAMRENGGRLEFALQSTGLDGGANHRAAAPAPGPAPGPHCARQRPRHEPRALGPNFRPIFHHQGARPGHRPRFDPGAANHRPFRRARRRAKRGRPGLGLHHPSAPDDQCRRPSARREKPAGAGAPRMALGRR